MNKSTHLSNKSVSDTIHQTTNTFFHTHLVLTQKKQQTNHNTNTKPYSLAYFNFIHFVIPRQQQQQQTTNNNKNMKFQLSSIALLAVASSTTAFAPSRTAFVRHPTQAQVTSLTLEDIERQVRPILCTTTF